MESFCAFSDAELLLALRLEVFKYASNLNHPVFSRGNCQVYRSISSAKVQSSFSDFHLISDVSSSMAEPSSALLPRKLKPKHLSVTTPVSISPSICTFYSDLHEVYAYIREWFIFLYSTLLPEHGSEVKDKIQVIHISNIKQFFFDCCILSKQTLQIVLKSLKNSKWVSLNHFIFAIESIKPKFKIKSEKHMPPIKVLLKKHINELLFYFKFFQSHNERLLGPEDLDLICKVALQDLPFPSVSLFFSSFFERTKKIRISFEEFFVCLTELPSP